MRSFEALETLAHFDYTSMRALDDHRASNEALLTFHNLLHVFFGQFSKDEKPDLAILTTYIHQMHQILSAINQQEYQFFLQKYTAEHRELPPQTIEWMAAESQVKSIAKIPSRMQFWAAGESFGDTIRYPEQHRKTVKLLTKWHNFAEQEGLELTIPGL